MVSQYHVKFDDYFETTEWTEYMPKSQWKVKSRLIKRPPSKTPNLDAKFKPSINELTNNNPRAMNSMSAHEQYEPQDADGGALPNNQDNWHSNE